MRVPTPRIVAAMVAAALVGGMASSCTDDAGAPTSAPSSAAPSAAETGTVEQVPEQLRTTTRKGAVSGRIGKGDRLDVVKRVAGVVDKWLAAAYVDGDYPRAPSTFDDGAWPGFTGGATRTARADKDLMSNADIAEGIAGLVVKKREITVDVLAVDRTARAATARVRLAFRTEGVDGERARKVTVTGRVFLTKRNGKWKVFGYDVAKARV